MNPSDQQELSALRQEFQQLCERLNVLDIRLQAEDGRVHAAQRAVDALRQEQMALATQARLIQHRLDLLASRLEPQAAREAVAITPAAIKPPPLIPPQPPPTPPARPSPKPQPMTAAAQAPAAAPVSPQPPPSASFEMQLGTYWLVRIGIVMLLMGLVFFGNYAYHNIIGKLGPGGKLVVLYLVSGVLLSVGTWLSRKTALKNYAQVLTAGGLAAVYFTTYAAYHVPALQVMHSALWDGLLLLGWAGFIIWLADRQKSEVLALFAVGLAYYTAIITPVGYFTLYSNLVLTVASIFFFVRNRWAGLSVASLVATYAGYAFWRFLDDGGWHWASPEQSLWQGTFFLISYWIVFTAAVFLSRHPRLKHQNRVAFLSLNNAAFFALFLLTMLQVQHGDFWKFALCYGAALLCASILAEFTLADEPLAAAAYLTQGLLLVTLGFITWFTGLKLALVLAVESVALSLLAQILDRRVLRIGSYLAGALSVLWAGAAMQPDESSDWMTGAAIGALMLFNAVWERPTPKAAKLWPLRPAVAWFCALALIIWGQTTWAFVPLRWLAPALALEALVFTAARYVLPLTELSLLGQFFLIAAQLSTLFELAAGPIPLPWWNPLIVVAITLALSRWWQGQSILRPGLQSNQSQQPPPAQFQQALTVLPFLYRAAAVLLAVAWIFEYIPARHRFWALALAGAALFAWSGVRSSREFWILSGVFTLAGYFTFWVGLETWQSIYFPNLLAILLLLVQQQAARRLPARFPVPASVHHTMILLAVLSLWAFITRWAKFSEGEAGFYLTVIWAGLALAIFFAGFLLQERLYRWSGLAILACALARVLLVDLWRLGTLVRMISFTALGLVLLVLGFIYTRFQERIRRWL